MRLLELFCGTKSISKVFKDDCSEIITLDILDKYNPTFCCSILDWDYTKYPTEYFDYIHASPPCIAYSQLQQTFYGRRKRNNLTGEMCIWTPQLHNEFLLVMDKLIDRTIEIIEYFKPKFYTIENPYHTKFNNIKNRPIMKEKNLPYTIVNYCMYQHEIKKPTIIFNNFNLELKLCSGVNETHRHTCYRQYSGRNSSRRNYDTQIFIPVNLCIEIRRQIIQ